MKSLPCLRAEASGSTPLEQRARDADSGSRRPAWGPILSGRHFAVTALLTASLATSAPAPATTLNSQPGSPIDLFDYLSPAQIADVLARTQTIDVTNEVKAWLADCVAQHRACRAMPGTYKISGQIIFEQAGNLSTGLTVYSDSPGQTIFASSYTGGAPFILQASGGTPSAPVSSTYAYLSGLAFQCNYAGPCLTIGKADYSDQINEFTLWRLSVQNFNGSASSTAYEFNAVFSGYVYANGSTAASPGRIATLGTITGGSGYTNGTYANVGLTGSSQGSLATANITVSGGAVTAVTVTSGGVLYKAGDLLTATIPGGSGFSVPVATVTNVQNDIFRIKQSAFTTYKIGGSSGWNFAHLTDSFSYGNSFLTPDCEIVANCYAIDSANAVRNTSIGGTYAYSSYGYGISATAGSFVAINPNINAITANFLAPGSDARAALWSYDTVPLTTRANFTAPVTTQNPSGTATVSITSGANTTNLNEDTSGNFIVNNTKSGAFTVFEQAGAGVLQFKLNGAQVAAITGTASTFNVKTTAPLVGTTGYTVSTLPASPSNGDRAFVTDAVACTFMSAVTGGGTTLCPVIYLGGWKAGG